MWHLHDLELVFLRCWQKFPQKQTSAFPRIYFPLHRCSFNPSVNSRIAHTCNYGMLYFLFGSLLYVIFDNTILMAFFLTFCTFFPIYFLPFFFLAISISLRLLKFDCYPAFRTSRIQFKSCLFSCSTQFAGSRGIVCLLCPCSFSFLGLRYVGL